MFPGHHIFDESVTTSKVDAGSDKLFRLSAKEGRSTCYRSSDINIIIYTLLSPFKLPLDQDPITGPFE